MPYTKLLPDAGPINMYKMSVEFGSLYNMYYYGASGSAEQGFGPYSSGWVGLYILCPDGQIGIVNSYYTTPGAYGPGGVGITWTINGASNVSTPEGTYHFYNPTSRSLRDYLKGGALVPAATDIEWPIPASGNIDMNQFRGAVKTYYYTIPVSWSDTTYGGNYFDTSYHASTIGWNLYDRLYLVNQAVLWSPGDVPFREACVLGEILRKSGKGIKFINNNVVVGGGGKGGTGGGGSSTGEAGIAGGHAIGIGYSTWVEIINNGFIVGGGGGGGAGYHWVWNGYSRASPGSGGASSRTAAAGGQSQGNVYSERGIVAYPSTDSNGDGYFETPGPQFNWGWGGRLSSPGGAGGNWGAAGGTGGGVDGTTDGSNGVGQVGGLGGYAIKRQSPSYDFPLVLTNNGTIVGTVG